VAHKRFFVLDGTPQLRLKSAKPSGQGAVLGRFRSATELALLFPNQSRLGPEPLAEEGTLALEFRSKR